MNGLTLSKLAIKMNISQQQQSRYERGINRVSLDRLYQYACVFEVSLSDFFILNDEEKKEIEIEIRKKILNKLGDKHASTNN